MNNIKKTVLTILSIILVISLFIWYVNYNIKIYNKENKIKGIYNIINIKEINGDPHQSLNKRGYNIMFVNKDNIADNRCLYVSSKHFNSNAFKEGRSYYIKTNNLKNNHLFKQCK